ncbi:sialidase family protein [Micromonospora sp. NPDC003776]
MLDCGGLHGHVKVSPKDGTVYVPKKGCGGNQAVAVSEDNGLTWQVRKVPTGLPADSDPSVGIGSDGTVYFGYQNADGHAHVAVSHDKGRTWESDQDVGAALGVQNVVFPAVAAGDPDRAAFAFLGTTTGGNYQDATNFTGEWHLYVTVTYDCGRTWSLTDATPNDAVQKGSICTGGTTCGTDRNLLDFMDIQVDKQGRVLVGYADGCTGACATGGAQNFDALATIASQSGGKSLFAAFDPVKTAKGKKK